ncbi:hypothetical protein HO173_002549 [Letharia columbiana]|uniref:Transcription elongation factor Eaf N-terminal domain-containing protein n=1 Tax=Letharia columbiana TaxID=112416 RepID=A0A8H6L8C7_9LECA|nr:uncharacterized protein HO173_002549 [Letharia columbiana]KAF6239288.1 hypothetical protein HO173_002549 [Letharia columbiana]
MAAMANSSQIDPSKPAKYPITISEQLLREDGPRKRRKVNIQLNHRPKLSTSSTKSIITPSSQGRDNGYNLSLTDEVNGDVYLYNGAQQPSEAVALIYDPNTQTFTLDKIDTSFRFNLRSTPSNKDIASLASQYPQLETGLPAPENVEDDLFDEGSANDHEDLTREADPHNPYDYRHFLKPAQQRLSPTPEPSPMPNHNSNSSPILTGHPPRPSKPKHRSKPPRSRHLSPNPREEADADNEDSENDDPLEIIDDSKPKNERPSRRFLAGLNEGFRGGSEPRSLRSVASSMSPSIQGDTSDEENGDRKSNADVEEIDLGEGTLEFESHGAAEQEVETPGNGWDDEDEVDLLEQELEQELERQADQDAGNRRVNGANGVNGVNGTYTNRVVEESSEESEEE